MPKVKMFMFEHIGVSKFMTLVKNRLGAKNQHHQKGLVSPWGEQKKRCGVGC
jgi:hypothetical protein